MEQIQKLINTAKNEIGYLEKNTNNYLDDKTKNAGANNYTKYGRDMGCNGYAWCDAFVDWCFKQTFGSIAKDMICGFSNYTPTSAQYYKNNKRFFDVPEIGDQVFFKNEYRICHTGIVYDIKGDTIYTIEGNTSSKAEIVANGGCVCAKEYKINNPKIAGYGRPFYNLAMENKTMLYGIDVSDCQGIIDWQKVKAAGVQFAILRTVKKSGASDRYLIENIKGCTINNIDLGFYKYSYAMTPKEAQEEAKAVIKLLDTCGVKPSRDIYIWFDCEEETQLNLGKKAIYDIYDCFKEVIWNSGFSYGLYMGKYAYENKADFYDLQDNVWIARYPDTTARTIKSIPDAKYTPQARGNNKLYAWQFSSKGKVDGIDGYVDLNVCYSEKQKEIQEDKIEYYKKPVFTLLECLARVGADTSKTNRAKIASKNGIINYSGTAEQNLLMLELLMNGKLKK